MIPVIRRRLSLATVATDYQDHEKRADHGLVTGALGLAAGRGVQG